MSTNDVPGSKAANKDVLAMGCWAEHEDGSLILVESVEADTVVYSIFDVAKDPKVEYRDAMPEKGFKAQFSWKPGKKDSEKWTWHDKTVFPWTRIMSDYPGGTKDVSAADTLTAAARVGESMRLRAGAVRDRQEAHPTEQRAARTIMRRINDAVEALVR